MSVRHALVDDLMRIISSTKPPFASVAVDLLEDGACRVMVRFERNVDPVVARAFLALDASRSMISAYGGVNLTFKPVPNHVQPVARKLGAALAELTENRRVSMFYWAMGPRGDEIQPIGEFDRESCEQISITGPEANWGKNTRLLPVVKHIVGDDPSRPNWGVIITDGIIEDEHECIEYCRSLGEQLLLQSPDASEVETPKFFLIGVGNDINRDQLDRFDDMFCDAPLGDKIDMWNTAVAADMRDVIHDYLHDIDIIVAPNARVYDDQGNEIIHYADCLPEQICFDLPAGAKAFRVVTPRGEYVQRIDDA